MNPVNSTPNLIYNWSEDRYAEICERLSLSPRMDGYLLIIRIG